MSLLPFTKSASGTIGTELELQIIDAHTFNLASYAKELIREAQCHSLNAQIKPEITQGMIEINTSVHQSVHNLYEELLEIQSFLLQKTVNQCIYFCGGGCHPFQEWHEQDIFPTPRYRKIVQHYRFFCKRATLFGQHVHVGCENGDDAIYLTHAFARYVPQLIALSASSPFYRGMKTGMCSSRAALFAGFPMCGVIPYLQNYQEFSDYFIKMQKWGMIESMKDLYWDVRPKPEFGTVEIRVLDTPLTLRKAAVITAYIQSLAAYLLEERPFKLSQEVYYLYEYNRYEAIRYGFDGEIIMSETAQKISIASDIMNTLKKIMPYARRNGVDEYINEILQQNVYTKRNDASVLDDIRLDVGSLSEVVAEQCMRWLSKEK